jgi:RNA polymerase sigma-70 factor (ECF subfamily)
MRQEKNSEKKLVSGILKNNEDSLRMFYNRYHKSLFSFISKRIECQEDAEEILQDVFMSSLDSLRDFSFKCSLFTFLCSIAKYKTIDFYRRKKIKKVVFSKFGEIEPLISQIFGNNILDDEILKEKVKVTFSALIPKYRIILKLKYLYGYSVDEIAEKLSITFKSAESLLFRARKAFSQAYAYQ